MQDPKHCPLLAHGDVLISRSPRLSISVFQVVSTVCMSILTVDHVKHSFAYHLLVCCLIISARRIRPVHTSAGAATVILRIRLQVLVAVNYDPLIVAARDHCARGAVDVDPEAHAIMGARDALHDLLGADVPHDDVAVLARRGDEGDAIFIVFLVLLLSGRLIAVDCLVFRFPIQLADVAILRGLTWAAASHHPNAAPYGVALVHVALVCLLHGAGHVDEVPQADARVGVAGQHEPAVGGEADGAGGGVVLVDERAEALAGGGIPDATAVVLAVCLYQSTRNLELEKGSGSHQPIRGAARHQRTIQTEVNAAHWVTMRRQAPHKSPRAHIPQEHRLIVAPARKYVALGAEGETVQVIVVAQKGFPASAAPNARITGTPADAPSTRTNPPNGGGGGVIVGASSVGRVACGPVPQADGLVVGAGG